MVPAAPFGDASEPLSWLDEQACGPEGPVVEVVEEATVDAVVEVDGEDGGGTDVEEVAVVVEPALGWCDDEQADEMVAATARIARVTGSLIRPP